MKIFLLGLPGSGKTTIGKALAEAFAIPFIDLDAEIERSEKATIKEIFDKKHEDYFRKIESEILNRWCAEQRDFVMATGGGAPCFFDNLAVINRSGKSVFLDVPASEIARRMMQTSLSGRPLFAGTNPASLKDQVEFMRSQRISYYRQAHATLSGNSITAQEIAEKIRTENQA